MYTYLTGVIIALGFYIGVYWPRDSVKMHLQSSDTGEMCAMLVISVLISMTSWIGVVAMIVNTAYELDKKNWNA